MYITYPCKEPYTIDDIIVEGILYEEWMRLVKELNVSVHSSFNTGGA